MAVSPISPEEFKKLYKNFEGSDTEFAEFLNKKFKTNLDGKAIYMRRSRLGIKTKNPKKIGDTAGFRKYIKNFKGKEIYKGFVLDTANRFGIDRGTAGNIIDDIRPDIKDLPYKATKETLRKAAVVKKNINYLDNKGFKEQYKLFKPKITGSDQEFADFLNEKGFRSTGGKPFTAKGVFARRSRSEIPGKNITTRGQVFSDDFILKEAKRLNINTEGRDISTIRSRVFDSRGRESFIKQHGEKAFLDREREYRKTTQARIAADPLRSAQYKESKAKSAAKRMFGLIPVEKTPKGLFWRDLVENSLRFKDGKLPESHIQFLNSKEIRPTSISAAKNIKLIDINVLDKNGKPKVLTYDNFLKHADDNSKRYGMSSKDLLKEYDKKRFIQQDYKLRDLLNKKIYKRYDPTNFANRSVFSPFHIHHPAGRARNAFNVQLGVGSENMAENALRTRFKKNFDIAKTLTDKKDAMKNYINDVSDNLEVRIKNVPYGKRETFEKMVTRVGGEKILTNEQRGAIKLYDSASQKGKDFLEARIGCSKGCFVQTIVNNPEEVSKLTKSVMPSIKYNTEVGAFVNTGTDDVASQAELKTWADDNPMEVKVGEAKPGILRKTGKALAHIGLPLPTAAMDAYFVGRQIEEGKSPTEIAKDPFNWLGLATMDPLTKAAGVADKSGKLASVMRLGMSPGMIRGATRFLGLPGLALSTGLTAYDQYQKYKNKEGFIYDLFNREEIDNAQV